MFNIALLTLHIFVTIERAALHFFLHISMTGAPAGNQNRTFF